MVKIVLNPILIYIVGVTMTLTMTRSTYVLGISTPPLNEIRRKYKKNSEKRNSQEN